MLTSLIFIFTECLLLDKCKVPAGEKRYILLDHVAVIIKKKRFIGQSLVLINFLMGKVRFVMYNVSLNDF